MQSKLLKEAEAAERLRVAPRTLTRWRWAGKGPSWIRVGGAIRYRDADIDQFIANGVQAAEAVAA